MKKSRIRVTKRKRRFFIAGGVLCAFLAVSTVHFCKEYQVVQRFFSLKEAIQGAESHLVAERGAIYDKYYTPLAENRAKVSVYCRTREVADPALLIERVSDILPISKQHLQAQFDSGQLRVWLAESIGKEQEEALRAEGFKGVYFNREMERVYPEKKLTAHLVGVTSDNTGLLGVEHYFDKLLTGAIEKTSLINGTQDIVLSLDLKIQRSLYRLLSRIGNEGDVIRVAGYVVDVKTGGVVAGGDWPSYDPNNFGKYSSTARETLFLQNIPFPESLQKTLVTSASLLKQAEDGRDLPWSVAAPFKNMGAELRLWRELGLDELALPDFAASQDKATARKTYVSLQKPSGETSLPSQITPMQLLMALARLSHGEGFVYPHVVDKVVSRQTEEAVHLVTPRKRNSFDKSFILGRKEVSRFVGASATSYGRDNYMLDYSQPVSHQGGQGGVIGQEIFFSFAPTPQADLAMLLIVERGNDVVGADATEITSIVGGMLKRVASLQQISAVIREGASLPVSPELVYWKPKTIDVKENDVVERTFEKGPMPELGGMSLRKSLKVLDDYNCRIKVEGTGWVASQYPPPGSSMSGVHTCRVSLQNPDAVRSKMWATSIADNRD